MDPRVLAYAEARFDVPTIFTKVCAREVASLRARARNAPARADLEPASALPAPLDALPTADIGARETRAAIKERQR